MKSEQIIGLEEKYIMQTYTRFPIVVDKGIGCYVFDKNGKKYLDFLGGIACNPAGHGNKEVANAIAKQAEKLLNISNLYYTEQQVVLAEKLVKISGLGKCFFCNSGAEANETAFKLARKITGKTKIIAMEHAFHGRTFGALAATWKMKYKQPFEPLVPGFAHVPYNNIDAVYSAIDLNTAAVIAEPIQGEAGIIVPDKGYLAKLKKICEEQKILLIADEVQSSLRTGKFFAYQHENIKPDIVTLAKGIANGVPIGICIANKGLDFDKGNHASTFGGNSLACAAANATIDFILKKKLVENAEKIGNYFIKKLNELKEKKAIIKEVRGKGLMVAIELNKEVNPYVDKCLEKGLIVNNVTDTAMRFLPPLTIKEKEVDECIEILDEVL